MKNIIQGASKKSFQNIEKVIDGKPITNDSFKSALFHIQGSEENIKFLNEVLKIKLDLDNNVDITESISQNLETAWYPYNVYLQYMNEKEKGNVDNTIYIARQLLTFRENPYSDYLYFDLLNEIDAAVNSDDIKN